MLATITGDAALSQSPKRRTYIAHVCNDRGGWGRGFTTALSGVWPESETAYRDWAKTGVTDDGVAFELGAIQCVPTSDHRVAVVNMLAQSGYMSRANPHPLSCDHLELCLRHLRVRADAEAKRTGERPVIQMPQIGAGLGGGDWSTIESLIASTLDHDGKQPIHIVVRYMDAS